MKYKMLEKLVEIITLKANNKNKENIEPYEFGPTGP